DLGLDRYDPTEKKITHIDIGLPNHPIHTIFEDREGNLYFGSALGTMVVILPDLGKIEFNVAARIIFEDSQGRIWIGSDGNDGLMQFTLDEGVVRSYKTSQGLPSNQVLGILEDNQAQLWISTGNGLARFNPESETFRTFKKEDGIQGDRFYYGSSFMTNTGELIFGGQHGLTEFNPDQLSENLYFPPVVMTNLKIFNKEVPIGEEFQGDVILRNSITATKDIVVDYNLSVLTIDYTALNYSNGSKIEYAYMLEGFDNEWNFVGTNRSATYTNLDPGDYVFRVRSTNNNGIWNDSATSFNIMVSPPFSKTLLFKILILLLICSVIYFIVIFILKREKLKNQLVLERMKSKELHKIDMMKFQFFTNISHEIRTPISLIISPLARIKNNSLSKGQILKDIDVVHRNALRLGKLVDQLLDFRKLEAGKLKLELSRGNIVKFLEDIIYMFKELSQDKQVKLNFYSALDQVQIYFDPDKIEKVMFNLLSNAFKHTSPGGVINVAVTLTYLTGQEVDLDEAGQPGEYVQITVRDTGCGIEENRKEHIFDRFYQGRSSEKNALSGSGIGLYLSRELIKLHKGRIFLKSQVGIGTEITFQFPVIQINKEEQEMQETAATENLRLVDDKIRTSMNSIDKLAESSDPVLLIMEDNKELLDFIQSIFAEEYTVLLAEDGETGLQLARESIPDLIISDVLMPRLDGVKVCKKLKNDFRTSHIPIILLTALNSKEHEKEGILGGADEYITKPFDPSLLKIKVDQLLATRRLLREKYSREYLLQDTSVHDVSGSPDDKFLAKLVTAIEENLSDPEFGTVKISQEVGVSRTQLYRKMAALTDMTVKEFIRSIRLKRAAQLIVQGDLNISEVAYAVGFQQAAYFRKCFKEIYGMTPSDFAKTNTLLT
ncbi:MAG: ATP-binding protein, partial [Bacteroidales bacterium]